MRLLAHHFELFCLTVVGQDCEDPALILEGCCPPSTGSHAAQRGHACQADRPASSPPRLSLGDTAAHRVLFILPS